MDTDLLGKLKSLRRAWGRGIAISPARGSTGRMLGSTDRSYHNVDRYGKVRAIDLFPEGLGTVEDIKRFIALAHKKGFTGVGVYLDTQPSIMIHLDNREGKSGSWSRIGGKYLSLDAAYRELANARRTKSTEEF